MAALLAAYDLPTVRPEQLATDHTHPLQHAPALVPARVDRVFMLPVVVERLPAIHKLVVFLAALLAVSLQAALHDIRFPAVPAVVCAAERSLISVFAVSGCTRLFAQLAAIRAVPCTGTAPETFAALSADPIVDRH